MTTLGEEMSQPDSQSKTYIKRDARSPRALELEALGLQWLAEAMPAGGVPTVPVLAQSRGTMTIAQVGGGHVSAEAATEFGQRLAITHATGALRYGCPPPGWDTKANADGTITGWMGRARLPFTTATSDLRWGEFFADYRLLPYLHDAVDNGAIDSIQAQRVETLCERLRDGKFDASEPALVAHGSSTCARIHGDLWCGNVLWTLNSRLDWWKDRAYRKLHSATDAAKHQRANAQSEVSDSDTYSTTHTAVLIDPATQGGHAETDLATLTVFGQRQIEQIYAGYNEVSELSSGWRERIGLHTLHILIVHAALFGGSYGAETVAVASRYC